MTEEKPKGFFEWVSDKAIDFASGSVGFSFALVVVLIWMVSGPIFNYSERWQLVINTGTSIVTFLMVFLLQRAQAKDVEALQLKLDELLSHTGADPDLVRIDKHVSEATLHAERERFKNKK